MLVGMILLESKEVSIINLLFREGRMRAVVIAMAMAVSLVFPCWADDDFKEGAQNVSQGFTKMGEGTVKAAKEVGKEVGKAFKKGGTEVGQGVSKMGKHAGQQAKETSRSVGQWFKDIGKKTREAFKQMGKNIKDFFTSD